MVAAEAQGRPPKPRAPENALVLAGGDSAVAASPAKRQKLAAAKLRPSRVNWSSGEALERLSRVIEDWERKKGEFREGGSFWDYCARVDVPRVSPALLLCANKTYSPA